VSLSIHGDDVLYEAGATQNRAFLHPDRQSRGGTEGDIPGGWHSRRKHAAAPLGEVAFELIKAPSPAHRTTVRSFLLYAAVGLIGTAVQYLILVVLVQHRSTDPILASATGFLGGAIVNYFANYYITFSSSKSHSRTLVQFLLVAFGGLLVNTAVMGMLTRALHTHYLIGQILASGAVLAVTFLVNRQWTFRES
jgi:putative flippase GtrA